MTKTNSEEVAERQFTSTSDVSDHSVLLNVGFKTLGERNRGRLWDRRLESFSSEAVGRKCGCNVHSIWPMSFGRKSRARDHPVPP